MRRKLSLSRLLILLATFLFACQPAARPALQVTRQPTFTPLVVNTPIPIPITADNLEPDRLAQPSFGGTLNPTGIRAVDRPLKFILVQHGRCAWDASWCPIEQGILDAARELNVTVTLLGPDSAEPSPANENSSADDKSLETDENSPDYQQTAALIDRAVAAQPDGIALTIPDATLLREPIQRAIASGIPIIAYHSGAGPINDKLAYLTYLGLDNYQGGYQGGQRLVQAGAKAGTCINPAPTQAAFQTRCKGFQQAFTEAGLPAGLLNTLGNTPQALIQLQDYGQAHPEVNADRTTNQASAKTFYTWLQANNPAAVEAPAAGSAPAAVQAPAAAEAPAPGQILHGTFDLNAEINGHIEAGVTLFGIDEQPYLQGYEAVFWLTMISRFGFKPATPVTATGPHFVDKTSLESQPDPNKPLRLIFVQHALCSWDSYWCVVERGIHDAAQERGVQAEIWGPETFDLGQMTALIYKAVMARPDGIGVTVPDPTALHVPIRQAVWTGYPIVAYDSGAGPVKDDLAYLTFIGVDMDAEYQGGYRAALRLINAGGSEGVCINHQMGHASLDARCRGMMDAFTQEGLKAEVLDIGADAGQALQILQQYAETHKQVNAYLTMGAGDPGAVTVYRYLATSNRLRGEVLHGTFDLSPDVVTAIEDGTSLFAVDGQPYLVGYTAVMFLTLALRQDIWPAESITPTGPGFVDLSNIAIVKQLAGIYR